MEAAMPAVKPIPDGYPNLTPYMIVRNGAAAIDFYQNVFGAKLRMKLDAPGGRIGHAELEIGNGLVMLADEHPFGHLWHISTHVEDVTPEEIGRRAAALGRGEHS
jgi:uncharacterized glyoxalase superfamily protein PhnB